MPADTGRPSDYRDGYADQAFKLCLLGASDVEMADIFGVSEKTLNTWKKAHPEFLQSIKNGKIKADAEVAQSLRHRALGYSHNAVKIFMPAGASEPVYAPYVEHYPPDTAAASLWLRNRHPDKWRDRREVTDPDGARLDAAHLLMVANLMRQLAAQPLTIDASAVPAEGESGEGEV